MSPIHIQINWPLPKISFFSFLNGFTRPKVQVAINMLCNFQFRVYRAIKVFRCRVSHWRRYEYGQRGREMERETTINREKQPVRTHSLVKILQVTFSLLECTKNYRMTWKMQHFMATEAVPLVAYIATKQKLNALIKQRGRERERNSKRKKVDVKLPLDYRINGIAHKNKHIEEHRSDDVVQGTHVRNAINEHTKNVKLNTSKMRCDRKKEQIANWS